MVNFHATFAFVENLFGLELRQFSRALLLRAHLTRGRRRQDRRDALLGQTALFHFADAAELWHVFTMYTFRTVVATTGFTLFATTREKSRD